MATNYVHGSTGSATSNAITVCLTSWEGEDMTELADVTSTCSGGWHESIPGLKSFNGTINGNFDANSPPETTYGFAPGSLVTLILRVSNSAYYSMSAYIESFKSTVDVGDVVKWTASFKSNGVVTRVGM
jgi:hypothetical protein